MATIAIARDLPLHAGDVSSEQTAVASRLVSLDLARMGAALAVVWIHAFSSVEVGLPDQPFTSPALFAVPFFAFVSVYFATLAGIKSATRAEGSVARDLMGRAGRLYIPFVGWTVIYMLLKAVRVMVGGHNDQALLEWALLWNGGSYHLWFLPFIMVGSVAAWVVGRTLAGPRVAPFARRGTVASLVLIGLALALVPSPFPQPKVFFAHFGFEALPVVFWGIAAALAARTLPEWRINVTTGWWAMLGLTLMVLGAWALQWPDLRRLITNLAGIGWVLVGVAGLSLLPALSRQVADWSPRLTRPLPAIAFGVYLIHIIPLGLVRDVGERLGAASNPLFAVAACLTCTALSAVASLVLIRFRATAWLLCHRVSKPQSGMSIGQGTVAPLPSTWRRAA